MDEANTPNRIEIDLTKNPLVRGVYLSEGKKVFFEMRALLLIEAVNEYAEKYYIGTSAKVELG